MGKTNNKRLSGTFEREIAEELSLWWTKGKDDSVFWRSQTSGGRATVRSRKGKKTLGQHSDLCPTAPCAFPMIRAAVIEIKKGYAKHSLQDLIDTMARGGHDEAPSMTGQWLQKAIHDHQCEGSYSWMIITRRNSRKKMVILDQKLYEILRLLRTGVDKISRRIHIFAWVPAVYHKPKGKSKRELLFKARNIGCVAMPYDKFFKRVQRSHFEKIAKLHKSQSKKK